MASRTLQVVIAGDTKGLSQAVTGANRDLSRLEKSGHKTLGSLKTGMLAVGGAAAAGVVVGLKKSADAAIEAEKANARLQAQLKASGIAYGEHAKAIQASIDKTSQLSGLDDEDLGDSFTNIVRITGDVNKALKLNALAADIARAKNMDVAKAGQLVAKAYDGNVGALKRYGVTVTPVTTAQDKLKASSEKATDAQVRAAKESDKQATAQKALADAQKTFGGQAEAYGKTTAGAADRSKVAFENLGESIGANVTPIIAQVAEGFTTLIRQITLGEGPGGRIRDVFEGVGRTAVVAYGGVKDLTGAFRDGEGPARALAATVGAAAGAFVAFKVGGVIVAGISAVKGAWAGLTAAVTRNPIGLIALGVTALATAIGILSIKHRENTTTSRDVADASRGYTDALRAQADALRQVRDIDIDLAQRRANLKSSTVSVEQAEQRLKEVRHDGRSSALDIKQAEADLRQARVSHKRAQRDLTDAEEDSTRKREDAHDATVRVTDAQRKHTSAQQDYRADLRKEIAAKEEDIRKTDKAAEAYEKFSDEFPALREKAEDARRKAKGLRDELSRLKSREITVGVRLDFDVAMNASPGSERAQGDGAGWDGPSLTSRVKAGVKANASRLLGKAGGLGGLLGGSFGGMGGGLMGADADLGPFAGIGARFGLRVSSGLRPGSITSSGNQSFHATGDAIDEAGSAGGMLGYFRFLKQNFGSRLRELIYTPGGVGIKDGRPFRYTGEVAADHYDHVHVAYTGPFGDGIGQIRSLWTQAGGSPQAQNIAAAIAMAESGGNPSASHRNSDGSVDRGLWQINSLHGALSTFNRLGNARAAVRISGNGQNWNPWTVFKTGAYKRFLSSDGGAPGAGGGGGGAARRAHRQATHAAAKAEREAVREAQDRALEPSAAYGLGIAQAGVHQARAESRDDLSGIIGALDEERAWKRRRLKRINKLLAGRLGRKRRTTLLQEKAQLIGEIGDLTDTIKEYKADRAGGATTITAADKLDAGVDTSIAPGAAAEPAAAPAEPDPNVAILAGLVGEMVANQNRIIQLTQAQGPAIVAALAAAMDGSIGGRVGLGYQSVGYAGNVAAY